MAAHVHEDAIGLRARWPHGLVLMALFWCLLAPDAHAAPATAESAQTESAQSGARDAEGTLIGLGYTIGIASGDLHEIIDNPSYRGIDVTLHHEIMHSWYIGVGVGYNHFHQDDGRDTYVTDWGAVTGTFYRAYGTVSLALSNRYYLLSPRSLVRPYAGVRLGVAFSSASLMVADVHEYSAPAGFLVVPEAGAAIRLTDYLRLSVGYQYDFTTVSFRGVDHASFHGLQVGAVFDY